MNKTETPQEVFDALLKEWAEQWFVIDNEFGSGENQIERLNPLILNWRTRYAKAGENEQHQETITPNVSEESTE